MKSKLGAILSLFGSAFAVALPYINVDSAASAFTTAHPAFAPVIAIALAIYAQHQPAILTTPAVVVPPAVAPVPAVIPTPTPASA